MNRETRQTWVSSKGADLCHIDKTGKVFVHCQITGDTELLGELVQAIAEASTFITPAPKVP